MFLHYDIQTIFKKQKKSKTVKGIFLTDVLTWMASVCSPVQIHLLVVGYLVKKSPAMTWTMTESAMPVVGPHVYFPPCSSLTFDILQGRKGIKT